MPAFSKGLQDENPEERHIPKSQPSPQILALLFLLSFLCWQGKVAFAQHPGACDYFLGSSSFFIC